MQDVTRGSLNTEDMDHKYNEISFVSSSSLIFVDMVKDLARHA